MQTRTVQRRQFLAASAVLLGLLGTPQRALPNDARQCALQSSALRLSLSLGTAR